MAPQRGRIVVPGRNDVSQQPGNTWKYLYERLPERRFQQLCAALLTLAYPDVRAFPVGQADGGRDAQRGIGSGSVIYQVKWTSKRLQSPATWLKNAIDTEHDNIQRLVAGGASHYVLMTNVAGTSRAGSGSIDRLDEALLDYSNRYDVHMTCWWQSDLDARVDGAPIEIKWQYQEMLAGTDAIRYIIDSDTEQASEHDLKLLLRDVIATQWRDDAKVKFKQVELDSYDLSSLFVDVHAVRTGRPAAVVFGGRPGVTHDGSSINQGAARYLLNTPQPFTLVRGEPGQGKSTLGQYVCQAHRAEFLGDEALHGASRPQQAPRIARMPLRVDLRDYGTWLEGGDPFDDTETGPDPTPRRRKRPRLPTVEMFLCALMTARSGGTPVTVAAVKDMLERFPMLIVLDGLDEIAKLATRAQAVREVNDFTARLAQAKVPPQVVVTTRPNASNLPEPDDNLYERVALSKLSPTQRTEYLRRWARARRLSNADRRALVRTFNKRSVEPHISQLADNPMQLTILLYLMKRLGASVPEGRTQLYAQYMETFLAREAEKSALVAGNREDLEEVTAFLGWHLQSRAELAGDRIRMSAKGIKGSINTYLFSVEKPTSKVADLFTAVTDRVWALSSKIDGFFEFDVQPVREYFAARFLWEYTGADRSNFDSAEVLRELLRRPYWLNTTRFYAGFARANEIAGLVESIEEELDSSPRPGQTRAAAWTLLTDGVFRGRTKSENRAASLFSDDLAVILLGAAIDKDAVSDTRPSHGAAEALMQALLAAVDRDPSHPLNRARLKFAAQVTEDRHQFDAWWQPRIAAAAGTVEETTWLTIGAAHRAAARLTATTRDNLRLATPQACAAALQADMTVTPETHHEHQLLRAVLNGNCSDAAPTAAGFPSDLLRACAPARFLRIHTDGSNVYRADIGHPERTDTSSQMTTVFRRLKDRDSRHGNVQNAMTVGSGQRGTTSRWGNTAREIAAIYGPCWLAADIAVIGAATPDTVYRTGGTLTAGAAPLGEEPDYGRLLQDIRVHRSNQAWWSDIFRLYSDPLSRATWALALTAVARADVLEHHLVQLVEVVESLPSSQLSALIDSSSRIGVSRLSRPLPTPLAVAATDRSSLAGLLVLHHSTDPTAHTPVGFHPDPTVTAGVASWPIQHELTAHMLAAPTDDNLAALKTMPYTSEVALPPDVRLSIDHCTEILKNPAAYPGVWVRAAERIASTSGSDPALEDVAVGSGWFAE